MQRFSLGVKQRTNSDDSVPPPGSLLSVLPRVHGLHVTVGQNGEREGEKETIPLKAETLCRAVRDDAPRHATPLSFSLTLRFSLATRSEKVDYS